MNSVILQLFSFNKSIVIVNNLNERIHFQLHLKENTCVSYFIYELIILL